MTRSACKCFLLFEVHTISQTEYHFAVVLFLFVFFSLVTMSEVCQDEVTRTELLGAATGEEEIRLFRASGFCVEGGDDGQEERVVEPSRTQFSRKTPAPSSMMRCVGNESMDGDLAGRRELVILDAETMDAVRSHLRGQIPYLSAGSLESLNPTAYRFSQAKIGSTVISSRMQAARTSHDPCCIRAVVPRQDLVRVEGASMSSVLQGHRFGEVLFFFSLNVPALGPPLLLAKMRWRSAIGVSSWNGSGLCCVSRRDAAPGAYCSVLPVARIVAQCCFVPHFVDDNDTSVCAVSLRSL